MLIFTLIFLFFLTYLYFWGIKGKGKGKGGEGKGGEGRWDVGGYRGNRYWRFVAKHNMKFVLISLLGHN